MRLRTRASGWYAGAAYGEHPVGRPTCRRHGVELAWFGAGTPWPLAPIEPEHAHRRWSRPATRTWRIRTHPQEIIENTVDIAHFVSVHRYRDVEITRPMSADGPHLRMSYAVRRGPMRMALDITASGVGYSRVEIDVHGLRLRTVVMPTPLDGDTTEVRAITQVGLPGVVGAAIGQVAAIAMGHDFAADIAIWENKIYQDPPRVCAGDGPIGAYRTWARQFVEAS
jgi:hypothetical protein